MKTFQCMRLHPSLKAFLLVCLFVCLFLCFFVFDFGGGGVFLFFFLFVMGGGLFPLSKPSQRFQKKIVFHRSSYLDIKSLTQK